MVGVCYLVLLRATWRVGEAIAPPGAAELWERHPTVGWAAAFVAWDLSGFVYHWVGHRTRVGWAAHQAHHSSSGYDLTVGLRQSWTPFHGLAHHWLLAVAGFDLKVVLACLAVSNAWQLLEHTAAPIRFPRWFAALVMTPAAHRHHHGSAGAAVNLGPVFTVWDRLAGTWRSPMAPAPVSYGPGRGTVADRGVLATELGGWRSLVFAPASDRSKDQRTATVDT